MNILTILVLAVLATFLGGLGALFLKKGSVRFDISFDGLVGNKSLILGVFFYGLAMITLLITYRYARLSFIYPLVSLSYVWVAVFSRLFLKESINAYKWLGILLIVLGIALINIR